VTHHPFSIYLAEAATGSPEGITLPRVPTDPDVLALRRFTTVRGCSFVPDTLISPKKKMQEIHDQTTRMSDVS